MKGQKMKYFASYTTNNGSTYNGKPFEYTNKREAIKSIREIARGETFAGNHGCVTVKDENGETVYEGRV